MDDQIAELCSLNNTVIELYVGIKGFGAVLTC
jgi:hypothetical protein